MEHFLGLLKIRVVRGVNLAPRDTHGADPYVVLSAGHHELKTSVKKNCLNPEWNDDLTISIADSEVPIRLEVFDKDRFSKDDKMGDAEIDVKPIVKAAVMDKTGFPNDTVITKVSPTCQNCLSTHSFVVFKDDMVAQDMTLSLRNVECGEVELKLECVNLHGSGCQ